jgi:cytochrome c oxidase subunit IV
MALRRNLQRRSLIVGTLIIVAGLIAASDSLHEETEAIIVWAEAMISEAPLLGMLVFVLLAMLSAASVVALRAPRCEPPTGLLKPMR